MPRLTAAQALVRFLAAQHVERDGVEHRFFEGCFGIFGHGNVAGIGQALYQDPQLLTYYQARNEQAMVHAASAFARMRNRLSTLACTTSIGPGATNLVTGAAVATVNRLPVLLVPGDVFASRVADPVLQQLEVPSRGDVSVNDALPAGLPLLRSDRAARAARPGRAVRDAGPRQPGRDGRGHARVPPGRPGGGLRLPRRVPRAEGLARRRGNCRTPPRSTRPSLRIRAAKRPLIVAGGGVIYSEATEALRRLRRADGHPGRRDAGRKGLAAVRPSARTRRDRRHRDASRRTGWPREADLVIGDRHPLVRLHDRVEDGVPRRACSFVNVNVADFDAAKHSGARARRRRARDDRGSWPTRSRATRPRMRTATRRRGSIASGTTRSTRLYGLGHGPPPAQSEVIGAVNDASAAADVVVCAAGSMPGDLHKLWRTRDPKGYHVEYGYSCMGYEIAGGLGVKMAAPEREVYVMVGDGSYLMMSSEIVTSIQEGVKLTIVLVDNHGFNSIGSLSRSLGTDGFGTQYRYRRNGSLGLDSDDEPAPSLPVDLAGNAESLGAKVIRCGSVEQLRQGLEAAKEEDATVVLAIEVDRYEGVPGYESWWDVPVAEVSEVGSVREARAEYEQSRPAP